MRSRRGRVAGALLAVAAVALSGACGDDDGSGAAGATATTEPAVTVPVTEPATTAPTTAPADFESALVGRLAGELRDPALAAAVVSSLGGDLVAALEAALEGESVAESPLLSYTPSTVADGDVDSLVVFAFGNRIEPDGSVVPGPTNEALAAVTAAFVADHPVAVFAQWEVADVLEAQGVPGVVSIEPDVGEDGQVVYLSTSGVADKAVRLAADSGTDLGRAGVIAFADHAARSVETARQAGMTADVPAGVELPVAYDPESGQPWTRDRATYIATDLQGRLLTLG